MHDVVADDLAQITAGAGADLTGRRVLVTGGAGFLGYYLVPGLLRLGAAVEVWDLFGRGIPRWLATDDAALTLRRHDVRDPLPDHEPADYLVHAASIASPSAYRRHPLATMDATVVGLRRLLDHAAGRGGVRGVLYLSTSEVYGDPERVPTPETDRGHVSATGPRACYDEAKRYGETLAVTFAREYGVPVTIARPFNNYGPGLPLDDGRVLPDLCADLLAGRDLTLLSDGSPTRTFCYVADAVTGLLRLLTRGRPGEAYNIGAAGPEVSIAELAERVAAVGRELFGYPGRVVRGTSPDGEYLTDNPTRRCPDVSKARDELGFEATTGLDDGLRRTLRWYAEQEPSERETGR